uniref:Uncharacterized protein n=1 Tax=Chromera velia CCMP2878 TaxID=1169474 RepID=A0A0G4HRL8_9ALVE|eukprot:Cvel_8107.t1-p1 / transcript=Cvel_8107.t1 / gene=Cvel_8107 / organism=Chromera_velia_CCMP2878 / gene_product=hypothetical protein / transcript_product=hypothetical protein / location=Cvel_scaffold441:12490-12723(+) / protein_length=78 / sequence_SO=supercontig / SO=protein_coding / is_pseudo=false
MPSRTEEFLARAEAIEKEIEALQQDITKVRNTVTKGSPPNKADEVAGEVARLTELVATKEAEMAELMRAADEAARKGT